MNKYSTWDDPFRPLDPFVARVAEGWFGVDGIEAEVSPPVGLLVGEQPGTSSNPRLPLWPYPPGSAGGRLHAMSGIPVRDYLLRLARVNIARRPIVRWNMDQAQQRVRAILDTLPTGARVVLVGARARDAACASASWFETFEWRRGAGGQVELVAIPHPSGRNQAYNDPAVRARAQWAVRWAAGMEQ